MALYVYGMPQPGTLRNMPTFDTRAVLVVSPLVRMAAPLASGSSDGTVLLWWHTPTTAPITFNPNTVAHDQVFIPDVHYASLTAAASQQMRHASRLYTYTALTKLHHSDTVSIHTSSFDRWHTYNRYATNTLHLHRHRCNRRVCLFDLHD